MERFQLNCYLYAPKDDFKHRLYWRDKYTEDEEADLKKLITEAKERNITFVYAISPGLDITYSLDKDVEALKEKLDQVKALGCTDFALLFDDIEPDMCGDDKGKYKTAADAQCDVTNKIYEWLNPEVFLFYPTEYCVSRTMPSLNKSAYLETIGKQLHEEIQIIWTGNHVVPREIRNEEIQNLTEIIKRKPVIWDNLFANDYDQTRLYLGPYDGRKVGLKKDLTGVLLNPNCEFEMNFVAMHTTAQWKLNRVQQFPLDSSSQDVEMEDQTESQGSTAVPEYNPRRALEKALIDWREEFYKRPQYSTYQAHMKETEDGDEMETGGKDKDKHKKTIAELDPLDLDDLYILSDLFCLPFDYGPRAVHFLKKAHWLISNVKLVKDGASEQKGSEWNEEAQHFNDCYRNLAILADKIINIPNRDILYDLYSYLSDIRSTLCLINSYIKWHGMRRKPKRVPFRPGEQEPWLFRGGLHGELRRLLPTEGRSDMFRRPEIRRATSRFFTVRPCFPSDPVDKEALYNVCRLTWDDGFSCFDISPGQSLNMDVESYPDLYADELIGGYLQESSDLCYVLEDELSICGFAVAATDGAEFQKKLRQNCVETLKEKYPESNEEAKASGFLSI
ncbi:hypothetical protein CAPTEDRAFT_175350 [Capitella teleta]|uniref:protein O-GlcNAcase n=1 Tax=Capitella teleta TaxID=283909 RepID=R7UTD2_CAPTE|nr:hypothetical protein CAPTEDRAFT_175350 [Capitella teleta]|eukprot:ELU09423.1 hypothetical protein CAPTEDRAFT_175350 [Capitella teleta]